MSRSMFLSMLAVAVVATVGTTLWATPADSSRHLSTGELWATYGGWISDRCCAEKPACNNSTNNTCLGIAQFGVCNATTFFNAFGGNTKACVQVSSGNTCTEDPEQHMCCNEQSCWFDEIAWECLDEGGDVVGEFFNGNDCDDDC